MLLSFSLLTNGEKLFNFCGNGGELEAINGLRALSFGWVVREHTFTFLHIYVGMISMIFHPGYYSETKLIRKMIYHFDQKTDTVNFLVPVHVLIP